MGKKRPGIVDDIPRRIYKSTIDRIDPYLIKDGKTSKNGKKFVKADFNKFLEMLIDTYEALQMTPKQYALKLYESAEEARGEAIREAARTKKKTEWPKIVVEMGRDG